MSNSTDNSVYSDGTTLHIPFPDKLKTYQIPLSELTTQEQLTHWIEHLTPKTWISDSQIERVKEIITNHWKQ